MQVISLFSGCGGLDLGFEKAGFEIPVANEFDTSIYETFKANHPNTKLVEGDIRKVEEGNFPNDVDGIIGGPPCQSWSEAGALRGIKDERGQLFYDYIRILKYINPKYFLLENVASMEDRWKDAMSEIIGCYPIMINSSDFCAAERKRYYWTNIPIKKWIPKDTVLKDIIFDAKDVPEKYWYTKYDVTVYDGDPKIKATLHLNSHRQAKEVYSINHKCNTLLCDGSGGNLAKKIYQDNKVRKLMPIEYERLQTLPDNYTDGVSDSARYTAIGNGWTVDVIAHILSGISLTDTKDCYFCGKYVKKRLF